MGWPIHRLLGVLACESQIRKLSQASKMGPSVDRVRLTQAKGDRATAEILKRPEDIKGKTVDWRKINIEIKGEKSRVAMVSPTHCLNLVSVFGAILVLGHWLTLASVLFLVTKNHQHLRSLCSWGVVGPVVCF